MHFTHKPVCREAASAIDQLPEPEDYVIERIVDHGEHEADHRLQFRVRWYGFTPGFDTWEPISDLPRLQVIRYCKRVKLAVTDEIDSAQIG